MASASGFSSVPYPRDLTWPEGASALAVQHPGVLVAPFNDPTYFLVTGYQLSDERTYRIWSQDPQKDATWVGLAITAGLHACLGRGALSIGVPAGRHGKVLSSEIALLSNPGAQAVSGAVEEKMIAMASGGDPAQAGRKSCDR